MFLLRDYIRKVEGKGFAVKTTLTLTDGSKTTIPGVPTEFTPDGLKVLAALRGDEKDCNVKVATGVDDVKGRPVSVQGKASGNAVVGILECEFCDETPAPSPRRSRRNQAEPTTNGEAVSN